MANRSNKWLISNMWVCSLLLALCLQFARKLISSQLKHGYALCWNMNEHILLYSPTCNSLFKIFHVIQGQNFHWIYNQDFHFFIIIIKPHTSWTCNLTLHITLTVRIQALKPTIFVWPPNQSKQIDTNYRSLICCIFRKVYPKFHLTIYGHWYKYGAHLLYQSSHMMIQFMNDMCGNLRFPHRRIDDLNKEKQRRVSRGRLPVYIIHHDTSTLMKTFFWSICHPI